MNLLIYILICLPALYKVRSVVGPLGILEWLALCVAAPFLTLIYAVYYINSRLKW